MKAVFRVIDFFAFDREISCIALEKECLRKILLQIVASETACVLERMEIKRKAVFAKRVAYCALKNASALRPAKIARIR